ncbi:MAG TPA: transglutaminase-like domain-containing protein [Thermodesulfobacteriota bacterium]|nr:transglutaminase-like domain-containing protein [Thermodesulfobacteriota bacterium]
MTYQKGTLITGALFLLILLSVSAARGDSSTENLLYIYSGGKKIGYSYDSVKTGDGVTEAVEKVRIKVKLLDNTQDIATDTRYRLDNDTLVSFDFKFESPAGAVTAKGDREGDSMRVKMSSLSGTSEIAFDAPPGLIPASLLPGRLRAEGLGVGREYAVPVLDPMSVIAAASPGSFDTLHKVVAKERVEVPSLGAVEAWKVESTLSGTHVTTWISDDGRVLKQLMPPGMTALRDEGGRVSDEGLTALDIVDATSIASNVTIKDPRDLRYMRAEIDGIVPEDGFDLSDGYRQTFDGRIVSIRAGDTSKVRTYELPNKDPRFGQYLAPENLIQSGDSEIVSKSKEIVGEERDALKAAGLLNAWVFSHLTKTGTAGIPNARDVLKTGSGDCNEHSALFAALARAAGIPTKTVSGTIYLDGRFYYHAWNEVYVGDWVAVDPTFGQVPADATHIKLVEGDLNKSSVIMNAAGKINLKILEAS